MPGEAVDALLVPILIAAGLYACFAVILTVLAHKTRTPNAWLAWVPIGNFVLMCHIAGRPGWWLILLLIPIVNLFAVAMVWAGIAKAVGKPGWVGGLVIVPLIGPIVPLYLAVAGSSAPAYAGSYSGERGRPDGAPPAVGSAAYGEPRCVACGAPLGPGEQFCGECGGPAVASGSPPSAVASGYCARCGAPRASGDAFCGRCGAPAAAAPSFERGQATAPDPAAMCRWCGAHVSGAQGFCGSCGRPVGGSLDGARARRGSRAVGLLVGTVGSLLVLALAVLGRDWLTTQIKNLIESRPSPSGQPAPEQRPQASSTHSGRVEVRVPKEPAGRTVAKEGMDLTAKAHWDQAQAFAARGEWEEAAGEYSFLVGYDEQNPLFRIELGLALFRLRQYGDAEKAFREAIRVGPNQPRAHNSLGHLLNTQKRYAESEPVLREAVRLAPNEAMYFDDLGVAMTGLNRWGEAQTLFEQAARLAPEVAIHRANLGAALLAQSRFREAEAQLRSAIQMDPRNGLWHANLAAALLALGRRNEALAEAQEAIRRGCRNHPVYMQLGVAP